MERIRNHDKLRLKRMEELIEQRTQQLKDHETGHRRLSDEVRIQDTHNEIAMICAVDSLSLSLSPSAR